MKTSLSNQDVLAKLVKFDTTTCLPTTELFDWVCEYLVHPGIRCERFDCGNGYENVWFETGPKCVDGEGVTLCGHVDTVPAEEPDWDTDPRELVEHDGRLHARGACDMKGFDAIAINLMREAVDSTPARPLCLLLTHSEEIGTIGAGQFIEQWPVGRAMPRQVIVGEPTSLKPVRGHKGHLTVRIVVGGSPCHTGFPDEGVNAIVSAQPLLERLERLRIELRDEVNEESALFPDVPYPVLNVVRINGGNAVNIMPEFCTIDVGIRLLSSSQAADFIPRLQRSVAESGLRITDVPAPGCCTFTVLNHTPPFGTPENDPFLATVIRASNSDGSHGVGYGTDAGRLEALGCRSVVFGPGDIAQAHRANEWMPVDEFERAPELLRTIISDAPA
jgi:acetylornithine deacetylase